MSNAPGSTWGNLDLVNNAVQRAAHFRPRWLIGDTQRVTPLHGILTHV